MNYGDIHWVDLPDRAGREQRGRRPAIIWQDTVNFQLPMVLIVPLTGKQSALRFPECADPASASNGLAVLSVALVFQLGACDVSRISTRIGSLDQTDLAVVQDLARRLQMLP